MPSRSAQDLVAVAKTGISEITCRELRALRESKSPHVLIDVREQNEWDAGHIDGAIHIPRGMLEFKIEQAVPDHHATIIVQCASGGRSALCADALQKMGYPNVKSLKGGYTEYCAESGAS